MILWLLACGEPISNAVFYDEAVFLGALPDAERLAGPEQLLAQADGSDPVLTAAIEAVGDLQAALQPLVICADALVQAEPDERDTSFRSWDRVPVVLTLEERTLDWWVRATVVEDDAGILSWTMDGAPDRIGPWTELARGQQEPSGNGWIIWELGALLSRLDLEGAGLIEAWYGRQDGQRVLQADLLLTEFSVDPLRTWSVLGPDTLVWSGLFDLTDDARTLPGYAIARHTPQGGRADGLLFRDEQTLEFGDCWDAAGHQTWVGGAAGVDASGDEASCALPPYDEP